MPSCVGLHSCSLHYLHEMPAPCTAFGCRSGYRECTGFTPDGERITFHSFPLNNRELCDKWVRANPRADFVPSKYSKICSRHFRESDFVQETQDSNATRRRRKHQATGGKELFRRHLKPEAVPSIFENVPSYLNSTVTTPRQTSMASASRRRETEAAHFENLEESFIADDKISGLSLAEINRKLMTESVLPTGFSTNVTDAALIAYIMVQQDDGIPRISASITVTSDLSVTVFVNAVTVPATKFRDLCTDNKILQLSQLINLMARVKAWSEEPLTVPMDTTVDMAVKLLERCLEQLDNDGEEHRRFRFLIEQLQLSTKSKHARVYSPQLLIMSYRLHAASAAAYKVMRNENVLCIPSTTTLKRVTRRLNCNTGLDNKAYLKLRISKLNQFNRNVQLMIDEIYISKRVE